MRICDSLELLQAGTHYTQNNDKVQSYIYTYTSNLYKNQILRTYDILNNCINTYLGGFGFKPSKFTD